MTTAPTLTLHSDSLLSKWGFNDGDMPDEIQDYLDEIEAPDLDDHWHAVLRGLVREHLLPALAEHHVVEVFDIETIHNPIRASHVDGREIEHYRSTHADIDLTPKSVDVPWPAVAAALGIAP